MSDESTNNTLVDSTSPCKTHQDSFSSPIIKQESSTKICEDDKSWDLKVKEDTLMTDAIINEPIVKMEEVNTKEQSIKDDTPVKTLVEVPASSSPPPQQSLTNTTATIDVPNLAQPEITDAQLKTPTPTTTPTTTPAASIATNTSTIAASISNTNIQQQPPLSSPPQSDAIEAANSTSTLPIAPPVTTSEVPPPVSLPININSTTITSSTATAITQTANTVSPVTSTAVPVASTAARALPMESNTTPSVTATNSDTTSNPIAAATDTSANMVTSTATASSVTATTTPAMTKTTSSTTPVESTAATSVVVPATPTPITTFEEIQKQLKNTLDHVEQRNMVSGFQTLSKATGAVVDHCEQLGLTSDDHPYNAIDREQFWAGLNNCWLYALAQRHEPSGDSERLTDQHLYSLREMVVSWADKLERFGLVDYEMGWWEADILAAIDGILAMNYAAAQAAAQAVVAQAAAALFGEEVNM